MLAAVTAALAFQAPSAFKLDSKVAAATAAAAVTLAAAPAFAADAAAGESIFSGNCAACHAGGQNVIMPEKTLEQAALEEYLDGGANPAAVVKQVIAVPSTRPARAPSVLDIHRKHAESCAPSLDTAGDEREERDARVRGAPLRR
jgi:cytochrome c6